MPIQVINRGQGLGARLGSALGEGLGSGLSQSISSGLEQMTQNKMKDMQANKLVNGLSTLFPGRSPEELKSLASLSVQSPELAGIYLKQQLQEPQNKAFAQALQGILGGENAVNLGENAQLNPQQAFQLAQLKQSQQKEVGKSQEKVKPFLDAHYKDMQAAKILKKQAEESLKLLQRIKHKLPGNFITGKIAEVASTDPDVRKLAADYNRLVKLSANFGKGEGVMTNFKLKLEQAAKAGLDKPIDTQEEILKDFIRHADNVYDTDRKITEIRKQNKGVYPLDLTQKLIEFEGSEKQPEAISAGSKVSSIDQSQIPVGKRAQNPKTKEIFIWDGNEWVLEEEFLGANNA